MTRRNRIQIIRTTPCAASFWRINDTTNLLRHIYVEIEQSQGRESFGHFWLIYTLRPVDIMMTSWNGNIFRVTGLLCGEFTGPRWIPRTKASDGELWCFLWSTPE